jgi:hypothetical protein
MKVDFKSGGQTFKVEFTIVPTKGSGFSAIAKSSKDLETLQRAIASRGNTDEIIGRIIAGQIEKQTKLPIDVDYSHQGAGFGFKIDMYSFVKSIK